MIYRNLADYNYTSCETWGFGLSILGNCRNMQPAALTGGEPAGTVDIKGCCWVMQVGERTDET